MIRIIDTSYIRIGNESYAEDNESYGLTTLTPEHVSVHADRVSFDFPAKSGKTWDVTISDRGVARVIGALQARPGDRLFSLDGKAISSDEVNRVLFELTGEHITAKNFRTWGGTLAAFRYLAQRVDSARPAAKVAVAAVDEAAEVLGNTRAVARSSYVHPHVLETYTEHTFADYLKAAKPQPLAGLDSEESRLAGFLTQLFDTEFSLLTTGG